MIYLDMDGVLADFDRGVNELCGMESNAQKKVFRAPDDWPMWIAIRSVEHFYNKLELMRGAKEMFDLIYGRYGDQCEILTGVPKPIRNIPTAGEDKIAWMRRKLSDRIKINIVLRNEKINFCKGPDCILIDDRSKTIREWEEKGGIGILHMSAEQTVEELKRRGLL